MSELHPATLLQKKHLYRPYYTLSFLSRAGSSCEYFSLSLSLFRSLFLSLSLSLFISRFCSFFALFSFIFSPFPVSFSLPRSLSTRAAHCFTVVEVSEVSCSRRAVLFSFFISEKPGNCAFPRGRRGEASFSFRNETGRSVKLFL